ncbi:MAG: HD-GYP domain-containing protein [Desulfobulbaceae bacterium]|nr:HD-GYP domain-containing protein [Desulfobulbaceae bacterium]HIJ90379.1 HD-GYP domain-containing protein [Deltaproteobacteria bacterium]
MIKKVPIEELQPGMHIERFDCNWLDHPFIFNRKKIKGQGEIDRLKTWGVTHVYIEDGQQPESAPAIIEQARPTPPVKFEHIITPQSARVDRELKHIPIRHEIVRAKKVRQRATLAAKNILAAVQSGKEIQIGEAKAVVGELDNSICHNKDALFLLMRLRNKDEYTFNHSVSVGVLLLAFCRAMNFDEETTRTIGLGGLLHDVGKMAVPMNILNKPGALNEEEFKKIQQHVILCREILASTHNISLPVAQIATEHHERFDGTGYPQGLSGEAISLGGQMASITDVFDALSSDRCYRNGIDQVEVLRKLYGWSHSHFNEGLVHRFIRCIGVYPAGTLVQLESGMLGVVVESTDNLLRPVVRLIYDTRHDWAVHQKDIDLSKPHGKGGEDRIISYESPKRWRINPLKVLGLV